MKNVLILCETSGALRQRFKYAGHYATSVDTLPADDQFDDDGRPTGVNHCQGDAFKHLEMLPDGSVDLIVAHPPCTALAVSGNAWYGQGMAKYEKRVQAMQWTEKLWRLCLRKGKRVAFENPVGVLGHTSMGKASQYIQPWQHGHPESKKTGLWLHNLPPLAESNNVKDVFDKLPKREQQRLHYLPPSADRWKIRSKTFDGIAQAIVDQWGPIL